MKLHIRDRIWAFLSSPRLRQDMAQAAAVIRQQQQKVADLQQKLGDLSKANRALRDQVCALGRALEDKRRELERARESALDFRTKGWPGFEVGVVDGTPRRVETPAYISNKVDIRKPTSVGEYPEAEGRTRSLECVQVGVSVYVDGSAPVPAAAIAEKVIGELKRSITSAVAEKMNQ